ncbi:SPOR domain-containing protein [Azospirillum endophyticum]|nr:SPOR domain-containing protein [Azospirillum endophyticum]
MKANGTSSETPPPENEDIAKLLRALNEDLRADPQDDDVEDEEEEPVSRGLPLGKIALALLVAGGIAVAVVSFGSGDPAPVSTAANGSAPMVPAPAITRAPANPAPAAPTASAPTAAAPAATPQAPAGQTSPVQAQQSAPSSAPPPPVAALPASPPPVLKVPEPPAVPATAPAATPKPRATPLAESAPPPAAQKPESPKAEAGKPEQPAAGSPTDTGSLQAMLAPPKDGAKDSAKRPPVAAPAAPSAGNGESKPAAKATPSPPAGHYTVQVGSFSVTANADSLAQRLQGSGFQAYTVDWTDSSNRSWRAVRVGGFPDSAAAKREAEQLKSKMGLNPVVVTAR